ncbi:MAG: WYL domain-containing protein [Bacillota bacterium]|nr:WYL domain-containing protein [Bacillota bacterium]
MAKGTNQKLKMLYLARIILSETDDQHGLTMPEIISRLKSYDVNADRKTIYMDIEELRHFGLDIISEQIGRKWYYYIGGRDFELPELKLLVDSVQSAKFITDKKSDELIRKIESLASKHEAKQLHRQVYISGRVKTMNESIYYNVDRLHDAIGSDSQIRFKYYQWNVNKEMELKRDGQWYQTSPWGLMWDDENYYLVAYNSGDDTIRHYRVDKMLHIEMIDEPREGKQQFKEFDLPRYTRSLFGMFGGEEKKVTIEAANDMVGVMIDRFGKDIFIIPVDDGHFQVTVNVAVSDQFLGWIIALGEDVKITAPEDVVKKMQNAARRLTDQYCVKGDGSHVRRGRC